MKKVLIMVQACTKDFYPSLMEAQMETWDSFNVPGVDTIYYVGQGYHLLRYGKMVYCPCDDGYNMMHWKFKLALDCVWKEDWDFIFRTNASTYVCKDKVLDFIQNCPTKLFYAGVNGGGYASGTGAILSRDCADIVRKKFDASPNGSEDSLIGTVLRNAGVQLQPGAHRLHYNYNEDKILPAAYYRCKSEKETPDAIPDFANGKRLDRAMDIKALRDLFYHYCSLK